MFMRQAIELSKLTLDPACQPRASVPTDYITELTEAYREAASDLPPIVVFKSYINSAFKFYVADGFCRTAAALAAGLTEIEVELHEGGLREAILYSVGANAIHGLRRTPEDKRRAVTTLLNDDQWKTMSDREVARACKVSPTFVGRMRGQVSTLTPDAPPAPERRQGKDGKSYPVPSAARRTAAPPAVEESPAVEVAVEEPPAPASPWLIEVPEAVAERLANRDRFKAIVNALDHAQKLINELSLLPGGEALQRECQYKETDGRPGYYNVDLKNARNAVKFSIPHAPCAYCQGRDKSCEPCRGTGYQTKASFEASPREMQAAVVGWGKVKSFE